METDEIVDWAVEQYGKTDFSNIDLVPNYNGVITYKIE